MTSLLVIASLLFDQVLGEIKRFHPLVGFGNTATWLERKVNKRPFNQYSSLLGGVCVMLLTMPIILAVILLQLLTEDYAWLVSVFALYLVIGLKSLRQHISPLYTALISNELHQARYYLARIVSRDTKKLNQQQITTAAVETTLENGCDAVFGAIFWFMIGGAPMAVLYRLINTLDAMWGYRNNRYRYFGMAAAKCDDFLNYIPARLTALSYAVCGDFKVAMRSWKIYAKKLDSPNAGPVMCAGAGSLDLRLGGPAIYQGAIKEKPYFGGSNLAHYHDLNRASRLVIKTAVLWCACLLCLSVIFRY